MYPVKKFENDLVQIFKENRGCFYPGCTCKKSDIIRSHTLQKSGSISLIAEDNHVYQYKTTVEALDDFVTNNYFFPPKRIGINVASTFQGFCASHDKQLFQAIEDEPIIPSIRQVNLFSFRSLCSELYRKIAASESSIVLNEVLKQLPMQNQSEIIDKGIVKHRNSVIDEGTKMGQAVMSSIYARFSVYLNEDSTSNLDYLLFKLDQIPQVQCSAYINPERDFNNNILQVLAKEKEAMQGIFVNIFANNGVGYVLFSWEKSHEKMHRFIENLLIQDDVINNIVALVFSYIENHVFSISWWENLSILKKRDVCNRVVDIFHANDFQRPKKYVNWGYTIMTNSIKIERLLFDKGILCELTIRYP